MTHTTDAKLDLLKRLIHDLSAREKEIQELIRENRELRALLDIKITKPTKRIAEVVVWYKNQGRLVFEGLELSPLHHITSIELEDADGYWPMMVVRIPVTNVLIREGDDTQLAGNPGRAIVRHGLKQVLDQLRPTFNDRDPYEGLPDWEKDILASMDGFSSELINQSVNEFKLTGPVIPGKWVKL